MRKKKIALMILLLFPVLFWEMLRGISLETIALLAKVAGGEVKFERYSKLGKWYEENFFKDKELS